MENFFFEEGLLRPPTVFQLPQWHEERLLQVVDAKFLAQFDLRDKWLQLRTLREQVRTLFEEQGVLDAVPKRNYQHTRLHVIVPAVDSDEAALLELLGGDLSDFFFGIPELVVETRDQNEKLPKWVTPIRTLRHQFTSTLTTTDAETGVKGQREVLYKYILKAYQGSGLKGGGGLLKLCPVCKKKLSQSATTICGECLRAGLSEYGRLSIE
jgi:hypothetical protein